VPLDLRYSTACRLKGAVRVSFVRLYCFALSTTTRNTKVIKEGTQL